MDRRSMKRALSTILVYVRALPLLIFVLPIVLVIVIGYRLFLMVDWLIEEARTRAGGLRMFVTRKQLAGFAGVTLLAGGVAATDWCKPVPPPGPPDTTTTTTTIATPTPSPSPSPTATPTPEVLGPYLDGGNCALKHVEPQPDARLGQRVNAVIAALTGCPARSDCEIIA